MLTNKLKKKIVEFTYQKPRTIQEIAHFIDKNWRTADRYIDKISKETGELSVRTFREGTRGALKIVYYVNIEKVSGTLFQERLLKQIENGKTRHDFSPFDIYQFVEPKFRNHVVEKVASDYAQGEKEISRLIDSAEKRILIFSGNLSFVNASSSIIKSLEKACVKGISVKIITRIDIATVKNIDKLLEINNKLGREAIEIRHLEQPVRCVLIDSKIAHFKEKKFPENYRKGELKKAIYIFYEIKDEDWLIWLKNTFYHLFRSSISSSMRLNSLNTMREIFN